MAEERHLPYSVDAEKSVLGAVLVDNHLLPAIASILNDTDFYRAAHKRIYAEMLALYEKRAPIDLVTLSDILQSKGALDECGGPAYISTLSDGMPRSSNIEAYAEIVVGKARLRRLIFSANDILASAYDQQEDVDAVLEKAGEVVYALSDRRSRGELVPMSKIVPEAFAVIELHANQENPIIGVETGFGKLDRMTSGLRKGDLIVIAARPGMGKTALGLDIANHLGVNLGKSVALFSLEMTRTQLGLRQLAMVAQVSGSRMLRGTLSDAEMFRVGESMNALAGASIYVDDHMGSTLFDVRAKCRALKLKVGLDLMIVDYLQLLLPPPSPNSQRNREREVAEISRGLKSIAKELDIPVLALAQLSRQNELRANKTPMLSDLRESGAVEQDADLVLFIHRPDMYPKCPEDKKGLAEIIIAKSRNGATGQVTLNWHGEQTRFSNITSAPMDF